MLKCSICKVDKSNDSFNINKQRNKRISGCKDCHKKRCQKWRQGNIEYVRATAREYAGAHQEQCKITKKIHYKNNRAYYQHKRQEWRSKNREHTRQYARDYAKTHKSQRNIRRKTLYKNSPEFKLECNLRNRLNGIIRKNKGIKKASKTLSLLGCTLLELKIHIEKQFLPNMSWGNHGIYGWHIDHIIPCSAFDLTKPEEQKKCFHYTNLQPLWAKENLTKSDKISYSQ